jgi:hypothetical protein
MTDGLKATPRHARAGGRSPLKQEERGKEKKKEKVKKVTWKFK